jgi:hypothetical protein
MAPEAQSQRKSHAGRVLVKQRAGNLVGCRNGWWVLVVAGLVGPAAAWGEGMQPGASLVLMDATRAPARVFYQATDGAEAVVRAWVPAEGTYELRAPTGELAGSARLAQRNVTFPAVALDAGWWSITRAGLAVSRFEAQPAGASFAGLPPWQVRTMAGPRVHAMSATTIPYLQGVAVFTNASPPACFLFDENDANQTVTVKLNTLTVFTFWLPWRDSADLPTPMVGTLIQGAARAEPMPQPPDAGDQVIFLVPVNPAPPNYRGGEIIQEMNALVQLSSMRQVDLYLHGEGSYSDALDHGRDCSVRGADFDLTVQRQP